MKPISRFGLLAAISADRVRHRLRRPSLPTIPSSPNMTANKPETLVGPVTKLEWINPHARLFMDVKDAKRKNGQTGKWNLPRRRY